MSKCPYSETIRDESSGVVVSNDQYKLWLEGYEAHMNENADRLKNLALLIRELENEITSVKPGEKLSATKG